VRVDFLHGKHRSENLEIGRVQLLTKLSVILLALANFDNERHLFKTGSCPEVRNA
jgi:hypothetical protein